MAIRVPPRGNEKDSLKAAMDRHRDAVLWKLQGLDDEQLRRPMTPSGTNLLGLVKHLAYTEYGWFCEPFGRDFVPSPAVDDKDDLEMTVTADETTADIIAFYAKARADADAAIEALDVEALGDAWFGEQVTMRWVLIHMVEETARHAGHMDILRELIDGAVGDHDRS
jgi:uncharacterized damage-inducible protein DinB